MQQHSFQRYEHLLNDARTLVIKFCMRAQTCDDGTGTREVAKLLAEAQQKYEALPMDKGKRKEGMRDVLYTIDVASNTSALLRFDATAKECVDELDVAIERFRLFAADHAIDKCPRNEGDDEKFLTQLNDRKTMIANDMQRRFSIAVKDFDKDVVAKYLPNFETFCQAVDKDKLLVQCVGNIVNSAIPKVSVKLSSYVGFMKVHMRAAMDNVAFCFGEFG